MRLELLCLVFQRGSMLFRALSLDCPVRATASMRLLLELLTPNSINY